jgi:hypothetical protein
MRSVNRFAAQASVSFLFVLVDELAARPYPQVPSAGLHEYFIVMDRA